MSENVRRKKKIRIKYRKRIRIKQRPKGNKVITYIKKHKGKVVSYIILLSLLLTTLFMLGKLVKHRVEMNKLEKDLNSFIPD